MKKIDENLKKILNLKKNVKKDEFKKIKLNFKKK